MKPIRSQKLQISDILIFQLLFINCSTIWTRKQDGPSDCSFTRPYRLYENYLTNITLLCGEELQIWCEKDVAQNFQWYRISRERFTSINSSEELNKMQTSNTPNKVLYLDQLTKHDIGWYLRIPSTSDNKRISENWFYLDVICDDNNEEQLYSEVQKVENATAPPYFAWNKYDLDWYYNSIKSRLSFSCRFRGYPYPEISWLRSNSLLTNERSNEISLEFEHNSQNEWANYTCKACNTNGCVNHTVVFELNSEPIVNKITRNVVAQVGQSVHLQTEFFSNSYPWCTKWRTNAKPFLHYTPRSSPCNEYSCSCYQRECHHTSNYTDIIRLENITKEHQGFYTYYAANFRGKTKHTIHLAVVNDLQNQCYYQQGKNNLSGKTSKNFTVTCAGTFSLECEAYEEFGYEWYHLKKDLWNASFHTQSKNFRVQINNEKGFSSLQLDGVTTNDTGWYTGVTIMSHNETTSLYNFWLEVSCDEHNDSLKKVWIEEIRNGTGSPYFTAQENQKFIFERNDYDYYQEKTLYLSCHSRGYPPPNITWIKTNSSSLSQSLYHNQNTELRFKKSEVGAENNGNYTCNVCNTNGCISKTHTVEITNNAIILIRASRNTTVQVGKSVELKCEFFSDSLPWLAKWDSNAFTFNSSSGSDSLHNKNTLPKVNWLYTTKYTQKIELNVTRDHQGSYTCEANNLISGESHTIYLTVTDGKFRVPSIREIDDKNFNGVFFTIRTEDPYRLFPCEDENEIKVQGYKRNFTLECGETFKFTCNTKYATDGLLRWYHLPEELLKWVYFKENHTFNFEIPFNGIRSESIQLTEVTTNDTGWYTGAIIVREDHTILSQSLWLEVTCDKQNDSLKNVWLEMIQNGTSPPYFTAKQTKDTFSLDYQLKKLCLKCKFRGYPTPNITWTKMHFSATENLFPAIETEYCLDNVSENTSNYSCTVCNINGCINREYKVQMKNSKPIFEGKTGTIFVAAGESINLTSKFSSDSTPWTTTWNVGSKSSTKRNNQDETSKIHYNTVATVTISLNNVTADDSGFYTCKAVNINGETIQNINLIVGDGTFLPDDSTDNSKLKIILPALALLILIAIAISLYCLYHKTKQKRQTETSEMIKLAKKVIIEKNIHLDEDLLESSLPALLVPIVRIERCKARVFKTGTVSEAVYEMSIDADWEYPREKLKLLRALGEGEFGKVVQAEANGILEESAKTIVAVKMLKDNHQDSDMIDLVLEMETMKLIGSHRNVLRLLGCCSQRGPLFVILEYAENGNLQNFLRRHNQKNFVLPEKALIGFSVEIATGMEYLASIRCIHRDLAARNILVTKNLEMKIADFGLARDIRSMSYYKKTSNGRVPIRWMAPESISHNRYTSQSDVWSYGILLWEIETYGGTPYPSVTDIENLLQDICNGYRMDKPSNCSPQIYEVMLNCWKYDPDDRPDFSSVLNVLKNIYENFDNMKQSESKISLDDSENNIESDNECDCLINE